MRWATAAVVGLSLVGSAPVSAAEAATAAAASVKPTPALPPSPEKLDHCYMNLLKHGGDLNCAQVDIPLSCLPKWSEGQFKRFAYNTRYYDAGRRYARIGNFAVAAEAPPSRITPEIIMQDEAGVVKNVGGNANAILALMKAAGATTFRMIVYKDLFENDPLVKKQYDTAINAAIACGLKVLITPALSGDIETTPEQAKEFGRELAAFTKGRVQDFTDFNEMNDPAWLKQLQGKSLAESASLLHFGLVDGITEDKSAGNKVYFGEINSKGSTRERYPLIFMRNVVEASDRPVVTELVTGHVYTWNWEMNKNGKRPILDNPNIKEDSPQVGLDGIAQIQRTIHELHEEGKLMTPDGGEPRFASTEFAMMTDSGGSRDVTEEMRSTVYTMMLKKYWNSFGSFAFYQFQGAKERWNSGLARLNGMLTPSFYAIQTWLQRYRPGQTARTIFRQPVLSLKQRLEK
jgi:hypothetical protein